MRNDLHVVPKGEKHKYEIEVTDLFGGEANYSWVRRYELEFTENYSEMTLRRRAKEMMGWNGVPCDVETYGDEITYRPRKLIQIAFVRFVDEK